MDCRKVRKTFRVVSIKGSGAFANFATDVPKLAQQLLIRLDEIENHNGTEIALFEPKRDADHLEGTYYVGIIVNERPNKIPVGMEYIETTQDYVTRRGTITNIVNLHNILNKWADDQGYKRDLESHIVETYYPVENGEEEIEIYLPLLK